jgi:hypothetical protein
MLRPSTTVPAESSKPGLIESKAPSSRRLDGVSISGDRALLDHLIDAAPQPIVA